jgi:hypothetical protein
MTDYNYEENGVVSDFVKFNKVGDFIEGVYVSSEMPTKPDKYGKTERKLFIKAKKGTWFESDGSKTDAVEGDVYRISAKPAIEAQMKKTVIGQIVRFKLTELKKSDKGNPTKIITVYSAKDAEGRPVIEKVEGAEEITGDMDVNATADELLGDAE